MNLSPHLTDNANLAVCFSCLLMKIPKYLDEYDFRARFVPSITVTLPIISAIVALFPPARQLYGLLIGPFLEAVLVLVLVRVARDEGKKIEPHMIKKWDGLPTTRYLRHRNVEIEKPTRERYKATLAKLTGLSFPSAEDEARDPLAADAIYASAIAALRERRRGKTYRLVFNENCNYGMTRNLLGLRRTGVVITLGCALAAVGGLLLPSTSQELAIFSLLVCALVFVLLVRFTTEAALKRTAEAYAVALLRTCEATRATANQQKVSA
jgi:hypothetical protein